MKPYKVIVWAPGHVGNNALAEAIKHPDLELVGVFSYSKGGIDAGELCGLPRTGVIATSSKEDIFSLEADVVIHCASKAHGSAQNDEDLVRLIESGKNVITTTSYQHLPTYSPALCERIEAACQRTGKTFFGTGENPGFMLERVVATLTGICHRLDKIELEEYADCSRYPGAKMVFDVMSMGKRPEELSVERPIVKAISMMYEQALNGAAAVLGVALDKIEVSIETAVLDHPIDIACGRIEAGHVVGQKLIWTGYLQGKPFLVNKQIWTTTKDIPGWDVGKLQNYTHDNYWRILLEGLPSLRLEMDLWIPEHDEPGLAGAEPAQLLVAMTAVRAIGEVCNAPPGILYAPVFAPYRPNQL
jgi:hypothetical protein